MKKCKDSYGTGATLSIFLALLLGMYAARGRFDGKKVIYNRFGCYLGIPKGLKRYTVYDTRYTAHGTQAVYSTRRATRLGYIFLATTFLTAGAI